MNDLLDDICASEKMYALYYPVVPAPWTKLELGPDRTLDLGHIQIGRHPGCSGIVGTREGDAKLNFREFLGMLSSLTSHANSKTTDSEFEEPRPFKFRLHTYTCYLSILAVYQCSVLNLNPSGLQGQ